MNVLPHTVARRPYVKIKSLMSCALGAMLVVAAAAAHAAPNLTGTWVLDRSQSELANPDAEGGKSRRHGAAGRGDAKLTVAQDGHTLTVTRIMARDGKERKFTETYTLDGTEHATKSRRGDVVTKALYEGDRLVVNTSYTMTTKDGERQMSRSSVWTVSPDGQTLTIETTMQTSRGERQMKTVYQKA
jgi:dipeptidyl aminopeptidase/acylaminoacyl peptidase